MTLNRPCWCGNTDLKPFGRDYLVCRSCETLVSQAGLSDDEIIVQDDENDFYGKQYWLDHQNKDVEFPDIFTRARRDLSERALYWLRTLLKYKVPPASVLEIGCSHGGFVALMRKIGFDATGMEISPWVVEFARDTFAIPVSLGPIEIMNVPSASLDVLAAMDVAEHLAHPLGTFKACGEKLNSSGIFLIQTPCYPHGTTLEELEERSSRFIDMLLPREHLYLFSQQAIANLFKKIGFLYVEFEPAIFAHYDMFVLASRSPLNALALGDVERFFAVTPAARIIQAFLDLYARNESILLAFETALRDSTLRLEQVDTLTRLLTQSERDSALRLEQVETLTGLFKQSEALVQSLQARLDDEVAKNEKLLIELNRVPLILQKILTVCDRLTRQIAGNRDPKDLR